MTDGGHVDADRPLIQEIDTNAIMQALPHLRDIRGKFIGIEGNIGSGKTTVANMLARVRQAHDGPTLVLFEPLKGRFKELLGRFYADPKRWGFTFQMHALQARFRQHALAAELAANGIDVVQDRTIYADGCFGMTVREDSNMDAEEWGIYEDTFGCMKRSLRYPDIIVYLRTSPEACFAHMRKRARSEEAGVSLAYLQRIHNKHEMLADAMSRYTRVLRVDWNEFGDIEMLNTEINKVLREERPFLRDWNSV
jgi:deoxyadenosine/deoxycytidine kinase